MVSLFAAKIASENEERDSNKLVPRDNGDVLHSWAIVEERFDEFTPFCFGAIVDCVEEDVGLVVTLSANA